MHPVRSVLSVPGAAQRFLDKAAQSVADVLMIDWEDGVAPSGKEPARVLSERALPGFGGRRAWVRVNGTDSGFFAADAAAVGRWPAALGPVSVVVPMARAEGVAIAAAAMPGRRLIPMIETAAGVEEAAQIAAVSAVEGLMFGELDYVATASLAGAPRMSNTDWAKARLVNAAAAAGKWAVAGPVADILDEAALRSMAETEASFGFSGKLCIHPAQVGPVNEVFLPTPEEQDWARGLFAELESTDRPEGAFRYRGRMVDAPVIDRARSVLKIVGGLA